jgi:proteasome lid subunit RPN8/RPN11
MLDAVEPPQSPQLQQLEIQRISLPSLASALDRIFDLGMTGAPEEVCGLIVNETAGVQVIPLRNRAEDPMNGYRIDSQTLRQLALKPRTWAHVAVYHTHPRGKVGPSAEDLEHKLDHVKYVVVTIPSGEITWF